MSEYPKFTFDKSRIPDFPPELSEDFKEYAKRQMQYLIPPYDDLAPKMSVPRIQENDVGKVQRDMY